MGGVCGVCTRPCRQRFIGRTHHEGNDGLEQVALALELCSGLGLGCFVLADVLVVDDGLIELVVGEVAVDGPLAAVDDQRLLRDAT